jgi:hypothetical protein
MRLAGGARRTQLVESSTEDDSGERGKGRLGCGLRIALFFTSDPQTAAARSVRERLQKAAFHVAAARVIPPLREFRLRACRDASQAQTLVFTGRFPQPRQRTHVPAKLERIEGDLWRLRIEEDEACFVIHADEFERRRSWVESFEAFAGLAYVEC